MQDFSLDLPEAQFEKLLGRVMSLIIQYQQQIQKEDTYRFRSTQYMQQLFDEQLPEQGDQLEKLLQDVERHVIGNATYNIGPNFYAYVLSCSNQAGMAGEFISTFLNQNVGKWHLAMPSVEMEKCVIRWIKSFIGIPETPGGILVSGGSMANLTALAVARNVKADVAAKGLFGRKVLRMYASTQVHSCVDKAVDLLGIGKDNLRKIAVDGDHCIDIGALEKAIEEDINKEYQPFCIVANAGTVNIGAVDSFNKIAEVCRKYDLWFHVDAAYGGPAAATDIVGEKFAGLNLADSIALDPHKWLYAPIEAGCVLLKNEQHLRSTYSYIPDYLAAGCGQNNRQDYMEYGMQLSRGFRALKIWMSFKAYGAEKIRKAIANDILKARYLAKQIESSENLELLAPVPLSIACFRYKPTIDMTEQKIDHLNQLILTRLEKDGRVFITGTKITGKVALRACIVNHRTQKQHLDYLLKVVCQIAQTILQEQKGQ